ncbi:anaerobic benzoate catabolism transcriptional regulator [Pigmentiphaga humi]|uniref:Anaerobic benzoate catabolism transcriptional regulator n=1 Tax=Pigmentiphaga humi TaxID=2478468 RepID=A0A3P4B153_9BURK|nr:helix-turn-helix transcriptional regulator [Pigmentiphaga humi]VCU69581.1 anaerobic benzoate catabolism transcriptional regulator [Pigmentiphaga humi]
MDIGSAIRQTREKLGLKLESVAMEAGFDAGNLSRIENGKQNPSLKRLQSIARAMNVGVTDLYALVENVQVIPARPELHDGDEAPYLSDETRLLRRHLALLDAKHLKLAAEFVKLLNRLQKEENARQETV